jgi:hypothetical protein
LAANYTPFQHPVALFNGQHRKSKNHCESVAAIHHESPRGTDIEACSVGTELFL